MPHGESWFSILPGLKNMYAALVHLGYALPGNRHGTWLEHQPISMQPVISAVLTILAIAALVFFARKRLADVTGSVVPEAELTSATFLELFVSNIYGLMADVMGPKAAKYFLPLIGTCAFFIFFSNLFALVPGFLPATNSLNTTLACGMIIFATTHIFGIKEHGVVHYFAHFLGPIRKWYALPLMILMLLIEIVSHVARPISLALRLMANMFADHLVLGVFLSLSPIFVPIPVMFLGVLVCVVQTLVFCILSCVYISMAVAHEEH